MILGRNLKTTERVELEIAFSKTELIKKVCDILEEYPLIGFQIKFKSNEDFSTLGGFMEFFNPNDLIQEAFDFYPGICAVNQGYIPIALCLNGSGDPYFIKKHKDEIGIFRIQHNAVNEDDSLNTNQVEFVNTLNYFISKLYPHSPKSK